MSADARAAARDEIWKRVEADGIDDDAGLLAIAAFDEAELAEALAGAPAGPPTAGQSEPVEPKRAYLAKIAVEGFRGIGPPAELKFKLGPGLTVVAGRNGSGKSSFAEAVEMLLTGENSRWENRPADWQSGWRNLHAPEASATKIEARLAVDGEPGQLAVRRWWDAGATAASASAAAVTPRDGEEPQELAALGWNAPLAAFRPFLPHSEVGSSVAQAPSNLYDAMYAVLGLQDVADALQRLRQVRLAGSKSAKAIEDEHAQLLKHIEDFNDDGRTAALRNLMHESPLDPGRIERAWRLINEWPSAYGLDYERIAGQFPAPDDVVAAIYRIQAAEKRTLGLSGGNAARSARIAALLEQALDLHQHDGDQDCPICGARRLDRAWRENAQTRLQHERQAAAVSDAAEAELRAALKAARDLVRPIPSHLADSIGAWGPAERERQAERMRELFEDMNEDVAAALAAAAERSAADPPPEPEGRLAPPDKLRAAAQALGDAWQTWAAVPDDPAPSQLVDHLNTAHPPLVEAAGQLDRYFADSFWELFPELTKDLPDWTERLRNHQRTYARLEQVRRAEKWLRSTLDDMRGERFAPISEHAVQIWNQLSGATNVQLAPPELAGSATTRKIKLEVLVDGAASDARGVMSQGELNSLALSLFLPRALLDDSPFGFVVIDDPVQAMDPSKVDGLARVLETAAEQRQVIVFTHDDRLPEAIRRLQIEADLITVTRSKNSVVQCKRASDPVSRYFDDALAIGRTSGLPLEAARRSTALFLRLAIEAACTDRVRQLRIGRGEPHAEVEALLERAGGGNRLVALALFGDAEQHARVRQKIANSLDAKTAEAYGLIQASTHTGNLAGFDSERLLRETERIVNLIRNAA